MTWEEDFLGNDRLELHSDSGELIGEIRRVAGGYEAIRIRRGVGQVIAILPSREKAQRSLAAFIESEAQA